MTARDCTRAFLFVAAASIVVVACGPKVPQPSTARMTIKASDKTNPDTSGQPRPVRVRVFQLRSEAQFNGAVWEALFADPPKGLAAELVSFSETQIAPSGSETVDIEVSPDTKFIGAAALFRDIANARWRVAVPVTPDHETVTVQVEPTTILLSAAD